MTVTRDVEIVVVGAELLKGERTDSHLAWLGRSLARHGLRVEEARVVRDDVDVIADAVRPSLGRARVVIVTGGLGPTPDDVTREGVARAHGRELGFDEASWRRIVAYFEKRGRTPTPANRRQACFPAGAEVMGNTRGTAPGFAVESRGTTTFVLPGPPHELQCMFEQEVEPRLGTIVNRPPLRVETFRTFGVGESQLMERVGSTLDAVEHFDVSSLPWITGVDIILTARPGAAESELDAGAAHVERVLLDDLGTKLYEHGERSLWQVVGAMLARRRETVALAESLTGGLVGTLLTEAPGSSAYLLADVVAYSNPSKTVFAGVSESAIAREGAVSDVVCREMAEGVRGRCGATWALSTTGIAGPTGATIDKPVGLVYLGVAWDGGCEVKRRVFAGDRGDVRMKSAAGVLWLLYNRLANNNDTYTEEE